MTALDQATAEAQRTMEIDPNYVYFEPNLARVYRQEGKLAEALEIYLRGEGTREISRGLVWPSLMPASAGRRRREKFSLNSSSRRIAPTFRAKKSPRFMSR